jgi:post-segregation antitoxin (ccd killing protein)
MDGKSTNMTTPTPNITEARSLAASLRTLDLDASADMMDALAAEVDRLRALAAPAALIETCRAALAEELSAWDIDPPLAHVKDAHDACVAWLAAPAQQAAPSLTVGDEPVRLVYRYGDPETGDQGEPGTYDANGNWHPLEDGPAAQAEPAAWRQALRDLAAALIEAERPDLEPCPPEMSQKLVEMAKPDSTLGILRDALASKPPAQGMGICRRCLKPSALHGTRAA